jgi:hypothetical protein
MYKIPPDQIVLKVIKKVMSREKEIDSQLKFHGVISKNLKEIDPDFHISPKRLRRVATRSNFVRITIKTRESDKNAPDRCPVCSTLLKYPRAEWEEEISTESVCPLCSYRTGRTKRVPVHYTFKLF